jgi:protein TonB
MKLGPHWIAAALSALTHVTAFGALAVLSFRPSITAPIIIDTYGNSDTEGFPIAVVSADAGAYEQGAQQTPGGEGADFPMPEQKDVPVELAGPTEESPAQEDATSAPPASESLPLPAIPAEPKIAGAAPATTSSEKKLPGAPGGANMRLGTPSAGGTVGKSYGVRMIDADSKPAYPEAARLRGIEGAPVIWLHISADGKVVGARIHKSSGHTILDEAALRWARTRRFVPAYQGNTPVEAEVTKEVRFSLF